ncbi:hypothetical protein DYB31_008507 [Aphanomyces astaci]|uniref:TBC1 domain family member 23 n=2 Tax=Aphanomyces astaci TaxID=112090 RepID=A0A397F5D1_APHAT|nr:hypothetical protein DYB31_008507 [Aphanomyces astaci]
MERKLLMRDDVPKHLLASMQLHVGDAATQSHGLQALYPLAFDAPHRVQLAACGSLPLCVSAMAAHPTVLPLQQHGCRFLQLMAFDDDCKVAILTHDGLPVVLAALDRFYKDKDLAISSSDLLYFLVADLDGDDDKMQGGIAPAIIHAVVRVMDLHGSDARIQSHGVAILNSLVANDAAKPLLCTDAVLDVVEQAIGFTDDATIDSIVLLFELFQDTTCQTLIVNNAPTTSRPIKAIGAKLATVTFSSDDTDSGERVAYIQRVLAGMESTIEARMTNTATQPSSSYGHGAVVTPLPPSLPPTRSLVESGENRQRHSIQLLSSPSKVHDQSVDLLSIATRDDEDKHFAVCDPKDELNSNCFTSKQRTGTLQSSLHVTASRAPSSAHIVAHVTSSPNASTSHVLDTPASSSLPPMSKVGLPFGAAPTIAARHDSNAVREVRTELEATRVALVDASKAIEYERAKVRKVIFNYKLMKRRLADQHKLLCVHNERSVADAEIHDTLLQRVRYLESALEDAHRSWSNERNMRVELENELSKGAVALATAQKALEDQRPPIVRERTVPEVRFLDAQRSVQQLTGDKLILEEAVKVAQELLYNCETNQFFLEAQVKQVRQQGMESLLMREEDVEIPKPSKYFTLASPTAKRTQAYSPTTSHADSQVSKELPSTLELNDQQAIEAFLHRAYKCLEACSEGSGVHFSILRRYLVDSGLASAPAMVSDVDVILNKVLAVAHENKLKARRRKDYEFSSCPQRPNFGKLRHRYFSRNLFCEAVTLVGAKKYPYLDNTTTMLREVILTFLSPYGTAIECRGGDVQLLVTSYDPFNFLKIMMEQLHRSYHSPVSTADNDQPQRKCANEPILQAMLEMVPVLQREQKPLKVNFAVDFEVIPAFLDRLAVKRLYKDILTFFKTFLAMYKGFPCPPDKKKYVAFYMTLGRLAVEIFKDKRDYDMPESQITGLLQWMDNSRGRGRIVRKGSAQAGIKFSNKLYAVNVMDELLFRDRTASEDGTSLEQLRLLALKKLLGRRLWQRWRIYDIGASMSDEDELKELLAQPNPRRDDVLELLQSKFLAIPERDSFVYRGIIWQVLLHVYDPQRQSSSADELENLSGRLASMPRDPLMCKEVDEACVTLQYVVGDLAQSGMETVLLWLLKAKSVPYTSGMAQALAPFFLLQLPLHTVYDCFYRYCALYLPHLVSGTFSLVDVDLPIELEHRQQLTLHLLAYHDPHLAQFLLQWTPTWIQRLVPVDYFYCNLYRRLPPSSFLYLLDQYLITNDMEFGLFVVLAIVSLHRDEILAQPSADGVKSTLAPLWALDQPDATAAIVLLATSLRRKTPSSYTHMWHVVPHSAFSQVSNDKAVDMTAWRKQESKTLTGRFYWYNDKTKVTQWEHPLAKHDAPPPLMCLVTDVAEIASVNLGQHPHHAKLRYFVVDCRGTRSSQDIKSGAIPSAYPLDPTVFDSPDLMLQTLETLRPLGSQVHVVLVGHGPVLPTAPTDEVAAHVREGVREDLAVLNRAALFFQKHGFRFVSALDGGYAAWHAFMRDASFTSVHELIGHEQLECRYCRVDAGTDPDAVTSSTRKKPSMPRLMRRRLIKMPTLPSLGFGGARREDAKGDDRLSVSSTSSSNANRDSLKGRLSLGGRWSLLRSRNSMDASQSVVGFDGEEDLAGEPMEPRESWSDEEIEIALPTLSA